MTNLLRQRHRIRPGQPDDFFVRNLSSILEARANSSRVMTLLLAAVASVSLLVGGVGIMNIMLVSVTERTREIGLRMAVGAKGKDILLQFLIEAVTLSLIGGLIGIALGLGGSSPSPTLAPSPPSSNPRASRWHLASLRQWGCSSVSIRPGRQRGWIRSMRSGTSDTTLSLTVNRSFLQGRRWTTFGCQYRSLANLRPRHVRVGLRRSRVAAQFGHDALARIQKLWLA